MSTYLCNALIYIYFNRHNKLASSGKRMNLKHDEQKNGTGIINMFYNLELVKIYILTYKWILTKQHMGHRTVQNINTYIKQNFIGFALIEFSLNK